MHIYTVAGNRYILTIVDYFSKWAEAIATPDKSAFQVANTLFKVEPVNVCVYLCVSYM